MTTGNLGVRWEGSQTEGQEPGQNGNKQWYDTLFGMSHITK